MITLQKLNNIFYNCLSNILKTKSEEVKLYKLDPNYDSIEDRETINNWEKYPIPYICGNTFKEYKIIKDNKLIINYSYYSRIYDNLQQIVYLHIITDNISFRKALCNKNNLYSKVIYDKNICISYTDNFYLKLRFYNITDYYSYSDLIYCEFTKRTFNLNTYTYQKLLFNVYEDKNIIRITDIIKKKFIIKKTDIDNLLYDIAYIEYKFKKYIYLNTFKIFKYYEPNSYGSLNNNFLLLL